MDHLTPANRSQLMSRVRNSGTSLELIVRKLLTRLGYRYRTNCRDLPGSPDIVFTRRKMAIFIHGCFWHGHGCRLSRQPKTRTAFWSKKIANNVARDQQVQTALQSMGWKVCILWQCELRALGEVSVRLQTFLGPTRWLKEHSIPAAWPCGG